jgi:MFS family permease
LTIDNYFEGTVSVSMAAVSNFAGILVCRFLLGAFEAGLFPGVIYFMSLWYPRKMQAIRLGFFSSFSALAGAFGGLLAYGISQIKSPKLAPWQLIFIVSIVFNSRNLVQVF